MTRLHRVVMDLFEKPHDNSILCRPPHPPVCLQLPSFWAERVTRLVIAAKIRKPPLTAS